MKLLEIFINKYTVEFFPLQNNSWKCSKLTQGKNKREGREQNFRKLTLYDALSSNLPELIFNWDKFYSQFHNTSESTDQKE